MTFSIEIVLRERSDAVTEQVPLPGPSGGPAREPAAWTDDDVAQVLREMLLAIDRVKHPGAERRYVALRGFSWIVEPTSDGGVVIAIEIPSGAAVAGPFAVEREGLDRAITRVLRAAGLPRPVVH
jgi:hypothetical protein